MDSWKTFPSGLNICGKGRLLYFNGHQQDQSMLLLHFLLFRLKDEANFEKKKKKKKAIVIALLSLLDQTVLPLPG